MRRQFRNMHHGMAGGRGFRAQSGMVGGTDFYAAGTQAAVAAFNAGGVNALLAFLAGFNAAQG